MAYTLRASPKTLYVLATSWSIVIREQRSTLVTFSSTALLYTPSNHVRNSPDTFRLSSRQTCLRNPTLKSYRRHDGHHTAEMPPKSTRGRDKDTKLVSYAVVLALLNMYADVHAFLLAAKEKIRPPSTYTVLAADPATKPSRSRYPPPTSPVRAQRDLFNKENKYYHDQPIGWHDSTMDTAVAIEGPVGFTPTYIHGCPPLPSSMSGFTEPSSSSSGLGPVFSPPRISLDRGPPSWPLFGDPIEVCLDSLNESPEEIIAVLKTAASDPAECGKWVVVGAHYRSRGNLKAAMAVISAMIEGERAVGL